MTHPRVPVLLAPVRTAAPESDPVSLEEAKAHLRVEHDADDAVITAMIAAATQHLDGRTGVLGRCLMPQTWVVHVSELPCQGAIALPIGPVRSVTSVRYFDDDGIERTLDAANYSLWDTTAGPALIRTIAGVWPATQARPDAVRIELACGYADANAIPAGIKAAIKLMVGDLYRNRDTTGQGTATIGAVAMSTTVDALLAPWRRVFAPAGRGAS